MEFVIALVSAVAAFVIPMHIHRQNHPRREVRYAVAAMTAEWEERETKAMRLSVWCTGRADIPSTQFDGQHPIVFQFSTAVSPISNGPTIASPHPWTPSFTDSRSFEIPARLLHKDFRAEVSFIPSGPFHVSVINPMIDIRIVRDTKVENSSLSSQERAITKSRARARVSLLSIAAWLTSISFVLFFVGVAISSADMTLGAALGGPSLLLFPVGLVLLAIAGINRTIMKRRSRQASRADEKVMR